MSSLIVEVCKIDKVSSHPNGDYLEIAHIKGWNCIVRKDQYKKGDKIVYIPPDSILPVELAERLGVRNYLAGSNKDRVKCAKLRGEMSEGLVIDCEDPTWEIKKDVKEILGILKYEPPIRATPGDGAPEDPFFDKFTEIENIKNFPEIFKQNEPLAISPKLNGDNSWYAILPAKDSDACLFSDGDAEPSIINLPGFLS